MRTLRLIPILAAVGWLVVGSYSVFADDGDTLPAGAVKERAVLPSPTVTSFRPVGELRVWSFYSQHKAFGRLLSYLKAGPAIDGRPSVTLDDRLVLNYALLQGQREDQAEGQTYLTEDGAYLGSSLKIGPKDSTESLELRRSRGQFSGYYTRAGSRNDITIPAQRDYFAWDPYFVDQLEVLLSLRSLSIGSEIDDSIVSPRSLLRTTISGRVVYFMWDEITKDNFDSVFVINLTRPFEGQAFFTPDKRLVRLDFTNEKVRVYQDLVRKPSVAAQGGEAPGTQSPFNRLSLRAIVFKLPYYIAFAFAALLGILMFTRSAFKSLHAYLCLVVGILLYVLVPVVQNPLVVRLVSALLPENGLSGTSAYLLALVPPVFGAVFQTALLLGALYGLFEWLKTKGNRRIGLAAFLAGGFAWAEACYSSGLVLTALFGWDGLGQLVMILFLVSAGTLLGGSLSLGPKHLVPAVIAVAVANAVMRYLPFFTQQRAMAIQPVHILMAVIALSFITATLILMRRRESHAER